MNVPDPQFHLDSIVTYDKDKHGNFFVVVDASYSLKSGWYYAIALYNPLLECRIIFPQEVPESELHIALQIAMEEK